MTRMLKQSLLAGAGLLLSATALAHPSAEHHFDFLHGLWHLVSEPDHLLMLLAGLTLFWFIKRQTTAIKHNKRKHDE